MAGEDPTPEAPAAKSAQAQTCFDLGYRCAYVVQPDGDVCADCGARRAVQAVPSQQLELKYGAE